MTQSIQGTIDALFAACRDTVYVGSTGADGIPVLVSRGRPGQAQPASIVAVGMAVRMPETRPTMTTSRSREQVAEIDSIVSVYVPGGESAQTLADAGALALQAQLDAYLRTQGTPALGGACRDVFLSNAVLVPEIAYSYFDDPDQAPIPTGRVSEITVTVTATIRF